MYKIQICPANYLAKREYHVAFIKLPMFAYNFKSLSHKRGSKTDHAFEELKLVYLTKVVHVTHSVLKWGSYV